MARVVKGFSKDVLFLLCALLWHGVTPSAIIHGGQRESQQQKDLANSVNAQSYGQESHHGDKLKENQNSLLDNKSNQFVGAKDRGQYSNQDSNKKIFDDTKTYGGQAYNQDSGERENGVALKKGHKKGHHNAGFHNSYHKDESSNNSSYFDDFSDEADQTNLQNNRGRFGNEGGKRYNVRKEDGLQQVRDNVRNGEFDRRGGTDNRNVDRHDYDRQRYQDDRRDISKQQQANNFNGRDREFGHAHAHEAPHTHEAPHAHEVPHYPEPGHYDRPVPYRPRPALGYHGDYYDEPRPLHHHHAPEYRRNDHLEDPRHQTITIYEDPRITEQFRGNDGPREEPEYVHLDVRPGGQRYQRFDNHHDPRRDWGVNRRSEINPLVFNYNRY